MAHDPHEGIAVREAAALEDQRVVEVEAQGGIQVVQTFFQRHLHESGIAVLGMVVLADTYEGGENQ